MNFIQLDRHALRAAAIFIFVQLLLTAILYYFLGYSVWSVLLVFLFSFVLAVLVFKLAMKWFLWVKLRKVYDSPLFENEPVFKREPEDPDLEKFVNQIRDFSENKLHEIEQLHNREDFRKEFLGDVSHELKTPLFTAQGYLLTVLDDSVKDQKLKKMYLKRAVKSIDRLEAIVKDLDMISRLETGMELHQKPFDLRKTITEVFDMLEFEADKKQISLGFREIYDYPVMVRADEEKIEQVLINLIGNSIHYGRQGGSTVIGIQSIDAERFRIDVVDDGIGIARENLPRLFERFYRADKSRSRDHGGSGLGLSIVKHILEAHNQKVSVESELEKGTTFSLTLNKANR